MSILLLLVTHIVCQGNVSTQAYLLLLTRFIGTLVCIGGKSYPWYITVKMRQLLNFLTIILLSMYCIK